MFGLAWHEVVTKIRPWFPGLCLVWLRDFVDHATITIRNNLHVIK